MNSEPESLQNLNSLDYWDYSIELECLEGNQDLQLAAELGKTLLERNKELETGLKQYQNIIEDQNQEIEYLTKQTVALREANESRLRIYEQLEVSIQDLERANHRLVLDNSAEKKHVKSLNATIESLEAKCEDLQSTVDDLNLQVDVLKRKCQRSHDAQFQSDTKKETVKLRHVENKYPSDDGIVSPDSSYVQPDETNVTSTPFKHPAQAKQSFTTNSKRTENDDKDSCEADSEMEQISQLLAQLSKARAQCNRDERRIAELEEQLATMIQQNQALENQVIQLSHRGDDVNMKSMHEELTTLEEVRQGQMCSRCLRSLDQNGSEILEEDDSSMMEALMADPPEADTTRSSFYMDVQAYPEKQSSPVNRQSNNPYKELVEKYEALVGGHRKSLKANSMSLQDEMQMSGDFNAQVKDGDEETRKTFSTPTDFSEAGSSGFADETSNKGTQTEGRGGFLCTIADGEDCKFSIYDDASPFDSRFRDRPEYRDLFREIFNVLKKAAENKEEGEDLPLLDDHTPIKLIPKVPPVTPCTEQIPEFQDDDTQSVLSSTMSELSISQTEPTTVIESIIQAQNEPIPEPEPQTDTSSKQERTLRPLIRQPLEFIQVERKRSSSRRKNKLADRSDSPATHIIGSPTINYSSRPNSGRRRREQAKNAPTEVELNTWNGNTMQFWHSNRNTASPTPSQGSTKYEFKPSLASQDLNKLKKLDLSYAEVLRNADNKKRELLRHRRK